jgi:glycosyltransferase involved in cell wall biosynthesis
MAPVASRSGTDLSHIEVSIVVPAYRADGTIARCLGSLLDQDFPGGFEVILCVSADQAVDLPSLEKHPRLKVLTHVPRLGAAAARNRAAAEARGRLIAFTDADVVADAGWLARLAAAADSSPCVAGSVLNGTPESAVGTAEYLLEFVDLHPARNPEAVHFGATCNLILERVLWEEAGPFPEDLEGGEDTLLTMDLRKRGLFKFAPEAAVHHVNRTRPVAFLRHQFRFGRFTARLAVMDGTYAGGPLRATLTRYASLAPIAAVLRVGWVYWRLAALDRQLFVRSLRCLPAVGAGSFAWGAGLVAQRLRERGSGR